MAKHATRKNTDDGKRETLRRREVRKIKYAALASN